MLKNWKSLFVKNEGVEEKDEEIPKEVFTFPEAGRTMPTHTLVNTNPSIDEVLKVYESGLDSINMPGFDFYEFFKSVTSTSHQTEQTYAMAFQMAKTLDNTISVPKLMQDAEFYISKINEVYNQYVSQGQSKLSVIQEKKQTEKNTLNQDIDIATKRINQLRSELQQLEAEINNKRALAAGIDQQYLPQESSIKEKLAANDHAKSISIEKLTQIRDNIQKFVKI